MNNEERQKLKDERLLKIQEKQQKRQQKQHSYKKVVIKDNENKEPKPVEIIEEVDFKFEEFCSNSNHFEECIEKVRTRMNDDREKTATSSSHLYVEVRLWSKHKHEPLLVMVRKSDCYITAIGTKGNLWEFKENAIPIFQGSRSLNYQGNYTTLFPRPTSWDININYYKMEQRVLKIIKENGPGPETENNVRGWIECIGPIILMIAESVRFGPFVGMFTKALSTTDEPFPLPDWVSPTVGIWEDMSDKEKAEKEKEKQKFVYEDITYDVVAALMEPEGNCNGFIKVLHYRKDGVGREGKLKQICE